MFLLARQSSLLKHTCIYFMLIFKWLIQLFDLGPTAVNGCEEAVVTHRFHIHSD